MENTNDILLCDGKAGGAARSAPAISAELLDQLLEGYSEPQDLLGKDGLLKKLMGALITRAMEAELVHHLGYEPGQTPPPDQKDRRNGSTKKRLRTQLGSTTIRVPRDRDGAFEPQIVPKHQRHFDGFDDRILAMYGRGMSVRDIRDHLQEIYGVEVSADLVSRATDAVVEELEAWQHRPLDAVYCIVYIDALILKIRGKGGVANMAAHIAVGVRPDGTKEVLGIWLAKNEGAKFWLSILTELRQRGLEDILVLCADGLKGLPEAVQAAYPHAIFQTCIVHMIRTSVRYVPWKERRKVCADLRQIYTAADEDAALVALRDFHDAWGKRFPMIVPAWERRWAEISPFLAFPAEIRRAIYTTNAIEALNRQIRKVLKTKGHFPHEQAAMKLVYLAVKNAEKTWGGSPHHSWSQALLQFAIHFEGRLP